MLYGINIQNSIDIVEFMVNLSRVMQTTPSQPQRAEAGPWLAVVAEQVSKLRFGIVQITVHEAKVVQIERTERIRLAPAGTTAPDQR